MALEWIKGAGKALKELKGSFKSLFYGEPYSIRLACLNSTGEEVVQSTKQVVGKAGKSVAQITEAYTPAVIKSGEELTNCVIKSRYYVPAEGTRLAQIGVLGVQRTSTPLAHGVYADVMINGQRQQLNANQLKSYINMCSRRPNPPLSIG